MSEETFAANGNDLLAAVRELQRSSRRSLPFTLGAAALAIASFAFAAWTIWDSNREIARINGEKKEFQFQLNKAEDKNLSLTGTLREVRTREGLPQDVYALIDGALKDARAVAQQLETATNTVQQQTQAINQAASGQQPAANAPPATQTVRSGPATGWDIDLFWCVVPNDDAASQANFAAAKRDAERISAAGSLQGDLIGRVRVRALSPERQGNSYPTLGYGYGMRPDSDLKEQALASKIRTLLGGEAGHVYKMGSSLSQTHWYLSLFICL